MQPDGTVVLYREVEQEIAGHMTTENPLDQQKTLEADLP
jgi:hypothetical protein